MKREKISEAMGNISSRHIKEAAEFKAEEKPHRNKNAWMKWVSIAACFCLITITALTVFPYFNRDSDSDPGNMADKVLPSDIDSILWNDYFGSAGGTTVEGYTEWNGFTVDELLYATLQNSSEQYIAVVMIKANGQPIDKSEYDAILDNLINRDYKNNNLYLFITKEQFLNWNLEDKSDYVFYLASRSGYEATGTVAPAVKIDDSVTGFAYEKFIFSSNKDNTAKNDSEVILLLNSLIDQWKYTYDCIEITIYSHIPEEELEALNYSEIMQLKYPDRTIIQVKYVDINMEALKELSNRSDISKIYISVPSATIDDKPTVDD